MSMTVLVGTPVAKNQQTHTQTKSIQINNKPNQQKEVSLHPLTPVSLPTQACGLLVCVCVSVYRERPEQGKLREQAVG